MCILGSIAGYMMGLLLGIFFTTAQMAIQVVPIIFIPFVIYGGLPVNLYDLPAYSSWIQYISPVRHIYSALMENILNTDKMHNLGQNSLVR